VRFDEPLLPFVMENAALRSLAEATRALPRDPIATDIMISAPALRSGDKGKAALALLSAREDVPCLAVINADGLPVGMVSRESLMTRLPNRYFHAVHESRPVDLLMDPSPLMVDAEETLDAIGEKIARDAPDALRTGFLVLREGRYLGIATGLGVLTASLAQGEKRMNEVQVAQALAQEATLSKSRFLAAMSHELRTPLNAIVGYANLLREEFEDSGLTQASTDLKAIETASRHLLSLINSVLDISKIEAGLMELQDSYFDLTSLLAEVAGIIRGLAMARGNRFDVKLDCEVERVWSDRAKLRQCLINLVGNAAKFTENGQITLCADDGGPGWIRLSVIDSGIGMTDKQIAKLFRPFSQADESIASRYGGSGLGLAIAKSFVDLMGGDISVESRKGKGSTFRIDLPLDRRTTPPRSA